MPKASTQFHELYAVGDSLSDSGGIFQLSSDLLDLVNKAGIDTDGLQPIPLPPYDMKFSNGPVLPEYTAELLGATLHNFSFGAANALGELPFGLLASAFIPADIQAEIAALPPDQLAPIQDILNHNIDLSGQIADLTASLSAHHPAHDSALVSMIGLNDLRSLVATFDPANPAPLTETIDGIIHANLVLAHTAYDLGIGTVIFETLPATTFFPIAQQLSPQLQMIGDQAVAAINAGLVNDALQLQQEGHDARVVDLHRMADEVQSDLGTFGLLSLQPEYLSDGHGVPPFILNPAAPPVDQTGFFDFIHMTTNLHGVLGAFAATSLTSTNIFTGDGNDSITGTDGNDLVLAGKGDDNVQLGAGNDTLLAGLGNDTANGGAGNDLMSGGGGDDTLNGNNGSDVLVGNAGNDTMHGGSGNDVLIDGPGNNNLFGSSGDDFFLFTQPQLVGGSITDASHIDGGQGNDTVVVRVDPTLLTTEQTNVQNNFHAGQAFAFATTHLTVTGVEHIVLTTDPHFADVTLPGGDLGARLHEADLFGFI
ncbi:Hemolysin-type calcium-binding repeat-containing protein [Rhodospirillales bacterium URHD0017]|nr:Hemolysin-type calcium-binding repeat-containing protein [Rhodospirillales bacterium URHD0017]